MERENGGEENEVLMMIVVVVVMVMVVVVVESVMHVYTYVSRDAVALRRFRRKSGPSCRCCSC